jgi:hypothetical protein
VVAGTVLVRCHVGAGRRSVGCRGVAHPIGELRLGNCTLPRGRRGLAGGRVASCRGARGPTSFHSRLARELARTPLASGCRSARSIRLSGCWSISSKRGGNRAWPSRPPRVKLVMVGDAHEVIVPCGLKVQALEPDFESGQEGV